MYALWMFIILECECRKLSLEDLKKGHGFIAQCLDSGKEWKVGVRSRILLTSAWSC